MPENASVATPRSDARPSGGHWLTTGLLVVPLALLAVTVTLTVRTGYTASAYTLLPSTAAIGAVGAVLAGLRPRYAGGWLMLATGIAFLTGQIAEQIAIGAASETVAVNAAWVNT